MPGLVSYSPVLVCCYCTSTDNADKMVTNCGSVLKVQCCRLQTNSNSIDVSLFNCQLTQHLREAQELDRPDTISGADQHTKDVTATSEISMLTSAHSIVLQYSRLVT